jgi:hypothetical protein
MFPIMPFRRRNRTTVPKPVQVDISETTSDTTATIYVETDVLSRCRLEWGLTASYGNVVRQDDWNTVHEFLITGLTEGTTYHYKVVSINTGGATHSDDRTFATEDTGIVPVISNVNVHTITQTTAQIEWDVTPNSTGRIRYGFAADDLSLASAFEPSLLAYHNQTLSGLPSDTQVFYQIESTEAGGNTGYSSVGSFTTLEEVAVTGLFGGIGMKSLSNARVGDAFNAAAFSFRAQKSLAVNSVRCYFQGGNGYSEGNGGTYTFRIYPDNGSGAPNTGASHLGIASSLTNFPTPISNPNNQPGRVVAFSSTTPLVAGQLYWVVMENVGSISSDNTSINTIWNPGSNPTPFYRWPVAGDWLFRLRTTGGSWQTQSGWACIAEFTYSDNSKFGNGYMEISYGSIPNRVGDIDAPDRMVRQNFTPTANIDAISVGVTLQKLVGSTGQVTIALRNTGSGRGTLIDSFTLPASSWPDGTMSGSDVSSGSSQKVWAGGSFNSPVALVAGTQYRLEVSTEGNSRFHTYPIRSGQRAGYGYSSTLDCFWPGGQAQYSTNGGSLWSNFDGSDDDLQMYLEYSS